MPSQKPQLASTRDIERDIAAYPNNLDLRLRLAERLDSDGDTVRAEFIRLSLEDSADGVFHSKSGERFRKLRALERDNRERWRPTGMPEPTDWQFHRGCVEGVQLKASDLVHLDQDDLFTRYPIRFIRVTRTEPGHLRAFLGRPFPHVAALDLSNCGVDDDLVDALVKGSLGREISWLGLHDNPQITRTGVLQLARDLEKLRCVYLLGSDANPNIDDDGYLPPAGEDIERRLGLRVPWFHREFWPDPGYPPNPFELLDHLGRI